MRPLIRASMTGVVAALVGILVMLLPFGHDLEERFGLSWLFSDARSGRVRRRTWRS